MADGLQSRLPPCSCRNFRNAKVSQTLQDAYMPSPGKHVTMTARPMPAALDEASDLVPTCSGADHGKFHSFAHVGQNVSPQIAHSMHNTHNLGRSTIANCMAVLHVTCASTNTRLTDKNNSEPEARHHAGDLILSLPMLHWLSLFYY